MILKDALRYYELNGTDFQTDLSNFAKLQKMFSVGNIPDDFTEQLESFTDKLLELWVDNTGGWKNVLESKLELPTSQLLIQTYCRVIEPKEAKQEDEVILMTDSRLMTKKRKAEEDNKTIDFVASLANADIDISQFMDLEIELVYKIVSLIGEKKKAEADKAKKKKRRT